MSYTATNLSKSDGFLFIRTAMEAMNDLKSDILLEFCNQPKIIYNFNRK